MNTHAATRAVLLAVLVSSPLPLAARREWLAARDP
jgi:hypothetical protein